MSYLTGNYRHRLMSNSDNSKQYLVLEVEVEDDDEYLAINIVRKWRDATVEDLAECSERVYYGMFSLKDRM